MGKKRENMLALALIRVALVFHEVSPVNWSQRGSDHSFPPDPHTLLCIAASTYQSLLSDGIDSLGKNMKTERLLWEHSSHFRASVSSWWKIFCMATGIRASCQILWYKDGSAAWFVSLLTCWMSAFWDFLHTVGLWMYFTGIDRVPFRTQGGRVTSVCNKNKMKVTYYRSTSVTLSESMEIVNWVLYLAERWPNLPVTCLKTQARTQTYCFSLWNDLSNVFISSLHQELIHWLEQCCSTLIYFVVHRKWVDSDWILLFWVICSLLWSFLPICSSESVFTTKNPSGLFNQWAPAMGTRRNDRKEKEPWKRLLSCRLN